MKNRTILLQFIIICVLLVSLVFGVRSCLSHRADVARLQENLTNYTDEYTALKLKKPELKTELRKDKPQYRVVDSLVKSEKAKPTQITDLYVAKVTISNTDTVPITNKETPTARDSMGVKQYKTPFTDSRNCISIAGYIVSTDSLPTVFITSQNATIETYDIALKRRWWQIWKPRTWVKTYTKCGNLEVIKMKVE